MGGFLSFFCNKKSNVMFWGELGMILFFCFGNDVRKSCSKTIHVVTRIASRSKMKGNHSCPV